MPHEIEIAKKPPFRDYSPSSKISKPVAKLLANLLLCSAAACGISNANAQSFPSAAESPTISGIVLSQANNKPVANVAVSVKSESEGVFRSVLTDYAGEFAVAGVPVGKYVIRIDEPGYEPLKASELLEGASLKISLYLVAAKAPVGRSLNTVSVHELKIPYKAQDEFRKGLERLNKNDLLESLNHFAKATYAFADFYEAYYQAGLVELLLGRNDQALESFQRAITSSGGNYALAQFGMGYALFLDGQFSDAEKVLRRGLELDASLPHGHAILGMVLLKTGRLDEAEKSEREALLRNPNFAGAYLILSDVYGQRQDYRRQLAGLDNYLKLEPRGAVSDRAREAHDATLTLLAKADGAQD